jgi:hypothetical protein
VVARMLAVGLALLMSASGVALGCQAKTAPTLDENFKTPDPGWGAPDDNAAFTTNGLALTPPANGSAWRWNPNYTLDGGDLCVTVVNPSHPLTRGEAGDVGLWFWGKNAQNFYTATLALDGAVAIDRLVGGVWHVVLAPSPSAAVQTQPGAQNEVEVTLHGDAGSLFVNGAKIADFHGDAPPKGGAPGVYGESGSKQVTWVFSRVRLF